MDLVIVAPCGTLCQTTIEKISLPGEMGAFTVLRGHAPIISRLTSGRIVYDAAGRQESVEIAGGFVRVLDDTVEVCAELPEKAQSETEDAVHGK